MEAPEEDSSGSQKVRHEKMGLFFGGWEFARWTFFLSWHSLSQFIVAECDTYLPSVISPLRPYPPNPLLSFFFQVPAQAKRSSVWCQEALVIKTSSSSSPLHPKGSLSLHHHHLTKILETGTRKKGLSPPSSFSSPIQIKVEGFFPRCHSHFPG